MLPEINAEMQKLTAELAQLLSCTDHVQRYLHNDEKENWKKTKSLYQSRKGFVAAVDIPYRLQAN